MQCEIPLVERQRRAYRRYKTTDVCMLSFGSDRRPSRPFGSRGLLINRVVSCIQCWEFLQWSDVDPAMPPSWDHGSFQRRRTIQTGWSWSEYDTRQAKEGAGEGGFSLPPVGLGEGGVQSHCWSLRGQEQLSLSSSWSGEDVEPVSLAGLRIVT